MKLELFVSPESTCALRKTNFASKITVSHMRIKNVPEEVSGREEAGGFVGRSAGVGPGGHFGSPGGTTA